MRFYWSADLDSLASFKRNILAGSYSKIRLNEVWYVLSSDLGQFGFGLWQYNCVLVSNKLRKA